MIKMTEKEKHDWYDLCDYIKYEILEYSPEMKIPQTLALRLKGLAQGNFMANKYIKPNASYTYEQISRMSFENHTEDKADYKTGTTSAKDKFDELW